MQNKDGFHEQRKTTKTEGGSMKGKNIVRALVVAMFFCVLCIPLQSPAAEKEITLKVANWLPMQYPQTILMGEWCKELTKRANGKVKVNYYPAGTLVPAVQAYEAVTKGISDVGHHVPGYTPGRFPLSEVIDGVPRSYKDPRMPTKLVNAFYKKFKPKEFDDVKILWFHAHTPGRISTKAKPIEKLEDVKGLKMKTYGPTARIMQLLGGTPVAMPFTDAYDSLSRGVLDGLMADYGGLETYKLGDMIKYCLENDAAAYSAVFVAVMNKDTFNSLPPDVQKLIDQMSLEYEDKHADMWEVIERNGKEYMVKKGAKIMTLSKAEETRWAEKLQPMEQEYMTKMKGKGLPGEEALKFAHDFSKAYKK